MHIQIVTYIIYLYIYIYIAKRFPTCQKNHELNHNDLVHIFDEATLVSNENEWNLFLQNAIICSSCLKGPKYNEIFLRLECSHYICEECNEEYPIPPDERKDEEIVEIRLSKKWCPFCDIQICNYCQKLSLLIHKYSHCDHEKKCKNCIKFGVNVEYGEEQMGTLHQLCPLCSHAENHISPLNPFYIGKLLNNIDWGYNQDYFELVNFISQLYTRYILSCNIYLGNA